VYVTALCLCLTLTYADLSNGDVAYFVNCIMRTYTTYKYNVCVLFVDINPALYMSEHQHEMDNPVMKSKKHLAGVGVDNI